MRELIGWDVYCFWCSWISGWYMLCGIWGECWCIWCWICLGLGRNCWFVFYIWSELSGERCVVCSGSMGVCCVYWRVRCESLVDCWVWRVVCEDRVRVCYCELRMWKCGRVF